MPQFILDSDGQVASAAAPFDPTAHLSFDDLDAFTQGYIEALFFTENAPGVTSEEWQVTEDHDEGSIPGDVGFSDLAPDSLASIIEDCAAFQRDNAALLESAYGHGFPARTIGDGTLPDSHRPAWDYGEASAGRDYWFTHNGHGVGFWDRGLGEIGDKLSAASGRSEAYVYLGDDGKVHVS